MFTLTATPAIVKPALFDFMAAPLAMHTAPAAPVVAADDESWLFDDETADMLAELAEMDDAADFAAANGFWSY